MFRIAVLCKTFFRGGAEKQALILAKLLKENKIDVCLINWNGNKIDPEYLRFIQDNSINYFPMKGSFFVKIRSFSKILRQQRISILVSYLTFSNFVSGLTKIRNRKILCVGGIRNETLPYYKFLFEKVIHNHCNDATVFNNFLAKDKFSKKGFNPDKIFVIQNAIEIGAKEIRNGPGTRAKGEIRFISVGRFVKQKDFVTALNSFSALIQRNQDKNLQYYVVGYGPLENEIRSLAKELKIEDKVKVLINPANIPFLLGECDIFLSTSLFEGVSNSIMEAMAASLPVVATEVGDNHFLVKDGINGYLVPCGDVESITEKLELLIGSEELRRELGRNGRAIIETDFSVTKFIENYIRLFSHLQQK